MCKRRFPVNVDCNILKGVDKKNAFVIPFYRPVLEIVSFTAYIYTGARVEFIAMQRANHAAKCIYISIGKNATRMRAFIRESKIFFVMTPNTNFPPIHINNRDVVGSKI